MYPTDEADRGRHPGFARHQGLAGGPGSFSFSFGGFERTALVLKTLAFASVVGCLLSSFGCSRSGNKTGDDKEDEATSIIKLVQDSQRSGREQNDHAGFMAAWASDGKFIAGRSETPDQYDTVLPLKRAEAVARLKRGDVPSPTGFKYEFQNVRVEISGDKATVRYRSILKEGDATGTSDEIFRLRKEDGRWRIYENRYWPIESRVGDKKIEYTPGHWEKLDAEVELCKQKKDEFGQTVALLDAGRFQDAHALAKKLTEQSAQDPKAWLVRGHAAVAVADAEDAQSAFHRALEIDGKTEVPPYIRARKN